MNALLRFGSCHLDQCHTLFWCGLQARSAAVELVPEDSSIICQDAWQLVVEHLSYDLHVDKEVSPNASQSVRRWNNEKALFQLCCLNRASQVCKSWERAARGALEGKQELTVRILWSSHRT